MDYCKGAQVVHYTTHHNWSWVVTEALQKLIGQQSTTESAPLVLCPRFRDLPSQSGVVKAKASYALFRLDIVFSGTADTLRPIREVRTRSDIFGFLDPKDSLTRVAQMLDARNCMPNTVLIPWNWLASPTVDAGLHTTCADGIRQSIEEMLSTGPKLLKAPLGSGGFGLYFVYCCTGMEGTRDVCSCAFAKQYRFMCASTADVEEIVRCHRIKAEEKAGFLDDLNSTFYGFNASSALAWSLQDVISGVRVRSPAMENDGDGLGSDHAGSEKSQIAAEIERRRCQVRAYVVLVNSALYLYTTYEVRLPCWNIDLDATLAAEYAIYNYTSSAGAGSALGISTDSHHKDDVVGSEASGTGAKWSNELENEYCGRGHGRPYNEHRNKGQTERYLLSELPELDGSHVSVTDCMMELFAKLKPVLLHRQRANASQSGTAGQEGLGHIFDAQAILTALQGAQNCDTQTSTVPNPSHSHRAEVAIVGVDLVLNRASCASCTTKNVAGEPDRSLFSAKIVEINNNPAMPAPGKNMSAPYREHLVSFVSGMMELAAEAVGAPFSSTATAAVDDESGNPRFVMI